MFNYFNSLPDKLKRITSGTELISEIDGLRFLAIFTVLIQHLHERFTRYTSIKFSEPIENNVTAFIATRGFVGVYVFFMISGFILALPFASKLLSGNQELKLNKYYIRRLTRLEPPFIIWSSILFIGFILFRNASFKEYLPHFLASITYTHGLIYHGWSPINPPTWTLEVEVQFYILAPLLAWTFFSIKNKIYRRISLITFMFTFMLVQQYFELFRLPWYLSILAYLHYFLAGFLIADIYLSEWKSGLKRSSFYDYSAIAALAIVTTVWDWEFHFYDRILEVILLFIFFISVFKGNYVNNFFTNRWIMAIGGMCYTIYLIHLPIAEFLMQITRNISLTNNYEVNLLVQAMIYLPLVFVLSSIGFLFFEKPFMHKDWPELAKNKLKTIFKSKNS